MSVKDRITDKLNAALAPAALTVVDESHKHVGHVGHPGSGHPGALAASESHFAIDVVSAVFAGKSRLECHRIVNAVLADELASGVHALAIAARPPGR